jgi:hypothetical protein
VVYQGFSAKSLPLLCHVFALSDQRTDAPDAARYFETTDPCREAAAIESVPTESEDGFDIFLTLLQSRREG